MLSKKSKEVKKLTDEKRYGPLGVHQIKINMKEPFKIEKKVKRDVGEIGNASQMQSTQDTLRPSQEDKVMKIEIKKEEGGKKSISKKKAKADAKADLKAMKAMIKIKNEE